MANGGQIKYGIGFNVDKSGLNEVKTALQEIKNMTVNDLIKINGQGTKQELDKIKQDAAVVETALKKAFNPNLGTVNISKFNQHLKTSNLDLGKIYQSFSKMQGKGQAAFRKLTAEVYSTNRQLKESHTLIEKMGETMGNTIKWGIASSALNNFSGSVQKAYGYVRDLDTSLNNIRIVTEKSAEEMDKFAIKANNAAKSLGQTTTAYTDAALIYYQQGLAEEEVIARADTTLKAANVTGQAAADVSEQLTAVWNGFQVGAEETELYVDKLAAVAATTAADLEELSTGMSKVASAANAMGVDIDQLNGHLATVVSVTRQAPESVGTAFKTIYARLGDLAVGGEDEFGVSLGEVSGKLQQMGIDILDQQGNMRDMGTVMEEVAEKWDGWTEAQRQAAAVAMAGKRQYNNLIALFDNWDMYTDAVNTSKNAMGTLQTQQDIYMESTEAHLTQLRTSAEDLYDSLLDTGDINTVIDSLVALTDTMSNFVDAIGGGKGALLALGSIGTTVFRKQLGDSLAVSYKNFKTNKEETEKNKQAIEDLKKAEEAARTKGDNQTADYNKHQRERIELSKSLSDEEHKELVTLEKQTEELLAQKQLLQEEKQNIKDVYKRITNEKLNIDSASQLEKDLAAMRLKDAQNSLNEDAQFNFSGEFQQYLQNKREEKELEDKIKKLEQEILALEKSVTEEEEKQLSLKREELEKLQEQKDAPSEGGINTPEDVMEGFQDKFDAELYTKEQQKSIEKAYLKYQKIINKFGKDSDEAIIAADTLGKTINSVAKNAASEVGTAIKSIEKDFDKTEKNIEQNIEENNQKSQNILDDAYIKSISESLVGFAGGIGQVISAWSTLSNLDNIWDNEDLTAGEKVLQTFENLTFALPVLATGLAMVKNSYGDVSKAIIRKAAVLTAENATEKIEIMTLKQSTKAMWEKITANKAETLSAGGAAGANLGLGASFKVVATNAIKSAAATIMAWAPVILPILALTGAVTGLALWFTKEQRAAEKAAEAVNEQTEAVNALKSAHQEINNSIQAYKDAQEQLNGLKKGTIEWTNALLDANNQVLLLLEKFPGLAAYIKNVDGKLEISQEGFDFILQEQQQQMLQAQRALMITQKEKADADVAASKEKFRNSAIGDSMTMETANKVSAAVEEHGTGWLADEKQIKAMLNVTDYQAKAIKENSEEVIKLAGELAKNTEAEKLYAESLAMSYLTNDDGYNNSANKDAILTGYSAELDRRSDSLLAGWNSQSDDVIQKAYMDAIGATEVDNTADGKAKYKIGNEWKEISDETARQFLAAQEAAGQLTDYAENMSLALSHIDLSDELEGVFTQLTESNLENVNWDSMGLADLQGILNEVNHGELTNDDAIAMGYERLSDMQSKISEQIDTIIQQKTDADINTIKNAGSLYATDDLMLQERLGAYTSNEKNQEKIYKQLGGISAEEIFGHIDWSSWDPEIGIEEWITDEIKKAKKAYHNEQRGEEANATIADEGLDSKAIQEYSKDLAEAKDISEETAKHIGASYARIQKGVQELSETFDEQRKIIEDSNATDEEKAQALLGLRESMADLLDIDASTLSDDFLTNTENLNLMAEAAKGNAEAIEQLRVAAGQDIIIGIIGRDNFTDELQALHNEIAAFNLEEGITIEADVDETGFIEKLNQMIAATGMTADQVNTYLDSMGYEPEIEMVEAEGGTAMQVPTTSYKIGWDGGLTLTPTVTMETVQTNDKVAVPRIKSLTSKGSASTALNANVGKATTKPTTVTDKGGSSSKPKTEKNSTLKKDIYHDINQELSGLSTEFERLGKAQDKLFGKSLIDNLNKQLKIIEKQKDATKRKLDIAKQEQALLRKQLEQQGVTFNKDGLISNYMTILDKKQAEYNKLVKKYNAMSADGQEAFQSTLDAAKEELELLNENIERYDELSVDEIPGLVDEITDMAYQEIELRLEKMNAEIEIKLDLSQAIQDWAEFEREVIKGLEDTDFLGYAQSAFKEYKDLIGTGAVELLTQNLNSTIAEIDAYNKDPENYQGTFASQTADGTWVVDEQAMMEKLKTDQESLMNYLTDLHDKQEEINQAYLDNIDKISEAYQEQHDLFSFIDDQLNHSMNVIKLLKGEEAYEDMAQFYDQKIANNEALLAAQVQERDYYKQMMEQETDPEARKKWEEMWKDSVQKVNATVEESLQVINDDYVNSIKEALKEIDDALGGTRTIKAKWDVAVNQDSRWMDGVNKAYNLATLENKFNESINSVDSIKGQRELNKLKEQELEKLREKDKLTQYDVDRANQLLDIEMKRIALEEAQKNKSKMRLRRDASGNYSYQFVADDEAQAQAKQELMDAQNSLYNMDKDHLREQQQELFAVWQEYQDLQTEYASLSIEERERRQEEYAVKFANLQQNMTDISRDCEWTKQNLAQSTYDSLNLMYEEDGLTFSELNAEKQRQLTEELGPTFRDTIDNMIDAINNPEEGYEAAWLRADENINQANEEVRAGLATIESTLGLTSEEGLRNTTSNYYKEAIEFAEDLAKKQGENILKYQGEQTELGKVKKALELVTKAWEGTYNASVQALGKAQEYITAMLNQKTATEAAIEAQEDLAEAVRDVGKALQEVAAIKASSGTGNSVTGNNGSGGGGGGGGGGGNNSTQTEAPHANQTRQAYKYQNGHMVQLNYKTVGPYIVGEPKKVKMTPGSNKETKFYKTSQSNVWFKYKKGGLADFTGPAWLDGTKSQPELVLNAHDTENMLAMVKMVRELMKGSFASESQSDSPETKLLEKIKLLASLVQELRDSANIRTENLIALADITNKINKAEELSLAERYEHDKALLAIQQEQLFASWEQIQRFTAGVDAAVKEINTDSIAKFNQTAESLKAMTAKQDKYNDLLQDIKIYADFPDATNADEIKAAFNNLALTASQRAYSTKK